MHKNVFAVAGFVMAFMAATEGRTWAQPSIGFVTPPDLAGPTWTGQVVGGGALEFVSDPSGDGFGPGSLQFAIGGPEGGAQIRFNDLAWTLLLSQVGIQYRSLADGTHCKHDHPKPPGGPDHDRSLLLVLDVDTDEDFIADDLLIFDPAVNGEVECGTWQTWDATQGLWYSANDKKGAKSAAPLSEYTAEHPTASLVYGGIRLLAGFEPRWKGFVGNLDWLGLQGPPVCTEPPELPSCVSGPAPTYYFRPEVPVF